MPSINSFAAKFQTTIFFNLLFERSLYVKLKDWTSNSVDPDETAHYEPSHLDLCCLQKPIIKFNEITLKVEKTNDNDWNIPRQLILEINKYIRKW